MKLQGRFGDIDTGIDDCVVGLHSFDRVLTHPYLYELTVLAAAPATVRVWSTGRGRLLLGYGLGQSGPRVARALGRRRPPFAQGHRPNVLADARKARDRKERSNQMRARPQWAPRLLGRRFHGSFSLRYSTPARYARLRGIAQREALPRRCATEGISKHESAPRNHIQRTYKGCEARATLSLRIERTTNPERVASPPRPGPFSPPGGGFDHDVGWKSNDATLSGLPPQTSAHPKCSQSCIR